MPHASRTAVMRMGALLYLSKLKSPGAGGAPWLASGASSTQNSRYSVWVTFLPRKGADCVPARTGGGVEVPPPQRGSGLDSDFKTANSRPDVETVAVEDESPQWSVPDAEFTSL